MTDLDRLRSATAAALPAWTGAAAPHLPEWRVAFTTDGSDAPTGIAPVCQDEDHDSGDGSVYTCCPDPAVEVECPELAEYLVALLNADRVAPEAAE
ncbi:hypothetical protein [Streptomyces tsukubensis]|uniref:hypothetical protein n=1 Tax=Streptomyces tsukubensis TaxID=83656 RepID=UPI00344D90E5